MIHSIMVTVLQNQVKQYNLVFSAPIQWQAVNNQSTHPNYLGSN